MPSSPTERERPPGAGDGSVDPEHTAENDFVPDPDLEFLYMPSQSVANAQEILTSWAVDSEAARAAVPPGLERYGTGDHETMDVFGADRHTGEPVRATVVFVHGGYWHAFYRDTFSYLAPPLVEAGFRVVIISYDLAPMVSLTHITGQVRTAISAIAQRWPEPLIVTGHSAGGHLTAMVHATDWAAHGLPKPVNLVAGVSISGLHELEPLTHTSLQPVVGFTPDEVETLSPARLTPTSTAPFLVAVGELESSAFHDQAELMHTAWPDVAQPPIIVPGSHHFGVCDHLLDLVERAVTAAGAASDKPADDRPAGNHGHDSTPNRDIAGL